MPGIEEYPLSVEFSESAAPPKEPVTEKKKAKFKKQKKKIVKRARTPPRDGFIETFKEQVRTFKKDMNI